jgi:hypothetical protein
MKKIILPFVFLFTLAIALISTQSGCTKETIKNTTDTVVVKHTDTVLYCTPSVKGLWTGAQQSASSGQAFTVSIKADGTMTYENIISGTRQFCAGTWTLTNSILTFNTVCIYGVSANVGVAQSFTANFNSSTGLLSSGQWTNTSGPTNSGTFTLTKVN